MKRENFKIEMVQREISGLEMWIKGVLFSVVKVFVRLANA
jgi:hypothetical protein